MNVYSSCSLVWNGATGMKRIIIHRLAIIANVCTVSFSLIHGDTRPEKRRAAIVAGPTAFTAKGSNEGAFKAMTKHIGFTKSSTFKAKNRKVAALHGTRSWEGAMNYMFADSPPYTSENNPFEMRMAASQQR